MKLLLSADFLNGSDDVSVNIRILRDDVNVSNNIHRGACGDAHRGACGDALRGICSGCVLRCDKNNFRARGNDYSCELSSSFMCISPSPYMWDMCVSDME